MKPYSITTHYKSQTKETLLDILDALGHTDHSNRQNKAEPTHQLTEFYVVSEVLSVANEQALQHLFGVIGEEEVYKVSKANTSISYLLLTEESLRSILTSFQMNMLDAAFAQIDLENTEENNGLLNNILLDTLTEDEMNLLLGGDESSQ